MQAVPPSFLCQKVELQGGQFIRLSGALNMQSAPQLLAVIQEATACASERVHFDLSDLEFLDSSGIGALLDCRELLRQHHKHMVLQWVPPTMLELLRSAKLDQVFVIDPNGRKSAPWERQSADRPDVRASGGTRIPAESSLASLSPGQILEVSARAKQKYGQLIQCASDAMVIFDDRGRIHHANRRACEFFGLSANLIQQKVLRDLCLEDLKKNLAALESSGQFVKQTRCRHSSKALLEAELSAADLGDGFYLAAFRGLSQATTDESQHMRQRFEALFRSILDGVLLVDEQGTISDYNRQFREVLGASSQELDGMPVQHLYDLIADRSEDPREFRRWTKSIAVELNAAARRDVILLHPAKRIIRIYTGPMRSDADAVIGRVWMVRDVTEQQRLEEQLLQSQKMESIGTLAGGIAHDFNNLLTGILGYSSILLREIMPDDPHYKAIRAIDASAQRAAELTQGLLAFSRRRETKMRSLRLNVVIRETVRLLGRTIPNQIELVQDLAGDLPCIRGDAMQLEQVIMNLCVNARDAMKDGGKLILRTANADLSARTLPVGVENQSKQFVLLSIQDTGCGMPEEIMERIFEPFFTTKGAGEGTGLGLALAYGIVRSHGGFIEVASSPGQGSRFDLYFPPSTVDIERSITTRDTEALPGHGECVLLVDDEPVVREVAETVLQQLGYRVMTAAGGLEAIEIYKLQGHNIDLVLLDMMMPKMRGEKLFAILREMNPNARIIVSTGNPELLDRFPEVLQHAAGFANKPYRMSDLSKALSAALQKQSALD